MMVIVMVEGHGSDDDVVDCGDDDGNEGGDGGDDKGDCGVDGDDSDCGGDQIVIVIVIKVMMAMLIKW